MSHPREQAVLSPPAVAHSLNEAIQRKRMYNLFYFWIVVDAVLALLTSLAGGYIRNHVRLSGGRGRS